MNQQPASRLLSSTALSFGQLYLFQEKAPRPVLYRPQRNRKRSAPLDLRHVALAGVVFGFIGSILVQILWAHVFR